jgi:hypothetical protein
MARRLACLLLKTMKDHNLTALDGEVDQSVWRWAHPPQFTVQVLGIVLSHGHPHMLQEVDGPSHFGAVLGTETLDVLERGAITSFVDVETDLSVQSTRRH